MALPHVFVLIVNWNGRHHLEYCLPSVLQSVCEAVQVVVIDNASTDDSCAYVQQCFPGVAILRNTSNLGFCEGNNVGIRYALAHQAQYVVLLNNDTRVEPGWLDALIEIAESDDSVALCAGQQYTWEGDRRIDLTLRPDWLEGVMTLKPLGESTDVVPKAYAAGCCMLIRCAVLSQIGLLDPCYFAYAEDVDLSLRAWIAGYRVVLVPRAVVYHRVKGTAPSALQMRWGYRNQLFTMLKNYEWSTIYRFKESILTRWVFTRNRIALQATLIVLRHLPYILTMRRIVQGMRRRSDHEIFLLAGLDV